MSDPLMHRPEQRPIATRERPLAELLGELSQDMRLLVRQEVALAKIELSEKASRAGKNAASLAVGGAVTYAGALALVAAAIAGLIALGVDAWLSALIVGIVVVAIGTVLVQRSVNDLRRIDPAPRRTIETLRGDVQWAKEQRQ